MTVVVHDVAAWSMEGSGMRGVVATYRDRIIMWLGDSGHESSQSVLTKDFGAHVREVPRQ
ncbi:hypothetical protein [Arthrobacter sp. cf158]|uniref:hypothetical protein n=1 Tax=Arthrobacter sp. cf158 TaxID=1761744 RepID=UPI001114B177|nr:hypothetical protein [Arthrobacter sp. cf158]